MLLQIETPLIGVNGAVELILLDSVHLTWFVFPQQFAARLNAHGRISTEERRTERVGKIYWRGDSIQPSNLLAIFWMRPATNLTLLIKTMLTKCQHTIR